MIAGGNHTLVSCREAAKGVSSVTLSCYHSTNHTPSVSLCSTAPPPGSRECTKPPLKGEAAHIREPEGSAAVRRIPFRMHQGESVQSRPDIVRIRLRFYKTRGAYRNPSAAAAAAPLSGALWIGTLSLPPLGGSAAIAAKGVPLVTLSCNHSSNHTPSVRPFGLPAPPSGSRGIVRIRPRFLKTAGACRNPTAAAAAAPLSGALGGCIPFNGSGRRRGSRFGRRRIWG